MRPQRGLIELLGLATAAYVPHLVEEALTGMHDDPLVVAALAGLAQLSTRHASYLVFQGMFVVVLASTLAFALGGRARLGVMSLLGVALVAEGHHVVRAGLTLRYDSGLLTSLPMPLLGAHVLKRVALDLRERLSLTAT
jgi:hypothetical protein